MAGYRELREDWSRTETDAGINGVRSFIEDAAGNDSLPDILDPFSTDPTDAYCLCRSIDAKLYHVSGTDNKKKLSCTFNTKGLQGAEQTWTPDPEQRNFQAGAEVVSIPAPSKSKNVFMPTWMWKSDGNSANDVHISKIVPAGTFTRSIKLSGDSSKNTWFLTKFIPSVGKVNDAIFENFRIGSVLFTGANGGAQYDKWGVRTWVLECQFSWKLIQGEDANGAITKDDWQYVMRPVKNMWDKPFADGQAGHVYLYEKADLKNLMRR